MRPLLHLAQRLRADCLGNFMIEFALVLPILFLMLAGLLDLGRYGLEKSAMLQGAREGAQYGIIASTDSSNINTTTQNATGRTDVTATNSVFCECSSAPGTAVACNSTCTGTAVLKKYITVSATAPFASVLDPATNGPHGWLGAWTLPTNVSASVTMIVP